MISLTKFSVACVQYKMNILMKLLGPDTCIDRGLYPDDLLLDVIENKLTKRKRQAIELRFDSDHPKTYKEMADEMGVSVPRTRQLVTSSISKVLNANRDDWDEEEEKQ